MARRRAEHGRHAHGAHARDARAHARELRRQGVHHGDPAVGALSRVRRARACRSSTTGPSSAATTSRLADELLARLGDEESRERLRALREEMVDHRACFGAHVRRRVARDRRALRHPRQGRADHGSRARHRRRRRAAAGETRRAGVPGRARARAACGRSPKASATQAAWFEADVTDVAALNRAVDATVERFGGIDVVIANAGIAPFGTVATIDPAAFERDDRGEPDRRVAHGARRAAARRRAAGLHPLHRIAGRRAASADARALRGDQGGRRGVLRLACGRRSPIPARASAWPTSASSTRT